VLYVLRGSAAGGGGGAGGLGDGEEPGNGAASGGSASPGSAEGGGDSAQDKENAGVLYLYDSSPRQYFLPCHFCPLSHLALLR
jgi:hypothetical protein